MSRINRLAVLSVVPATKEAWVVYYDPEEIFVDRILFFAIVEDPDEPGYPYFMPVCEQDAGTTFNDVDDFHGDSLGICYGEWNEEQKEKWNKIGESRAKVEKTP